MLHTVQDELGLPPLPPLPGPPPDGVGPPPGLPPGPPSSERTGVQPGPPPPPMAKPFGARGDLMSEISSQAEPPAGMTRVQQLALKRKQKLQTEAAASPSVQPPDGAAASTGLSSSEPPAGLSKMQELAWKRQQRLLERGTTSQ